MTLTRFVSSVVVLGLGAGAAHADGVVGGPSDATVGPGFVTMDRQDASSRAGVELSYLSTKGDGDLTALRIEGHGQFVDPRSGFGGYFSLPINYISAGDDSATAIADIELGGLMVRQVGNNIALALHAGVALPTASDSLDKATANAIGMQSRITDFYLVIPGGLSLRLGGSLLYRQDRLFARADLGIDLNLSASGEDTAKPAIRYNGGVGYDVGPAALMAELTNTSFTGDGGATIDYIALAARFHAGTVQPYVGLLIPIDDDARSSIDLAFTVGIDGSLR